MPESHPPALGAEIAHPGAEGGGLPWIPIATLDHRYPGWGATIGERRATVLKKPTAKGPRYMFTSIGGDRPAVFSHPSFVNASQAKAAAMACMVPA